MLIYVPTIYTLNFLLNTKVYLKKNYKLWAFSVLREDEFILECDSVGRLERVQIGHDNSGLAPGWFLDTLTVQQVHLISSIDT